MTYRPRSSAATAVCSNWRWLLVCGCLILSTTGASGSTGLLHRRRTTTPDPLQAAFDRGRVLGSQQRRPPATRASDGQQRQTATGQQAQDDQDGSDTIGINFGLGLGLDTPLLDSLLDRLIRRKQLLMAAAAAAYPAINWGVTATGAGGFFPGGALWPYAGGGLGVGIGNGGFGGGGGGFGGGGGGGGFGGGNGGGGGFPWNRPAAYPVPVPVPVPAVNPFGGGGGGGGWGPFGGGGGSGGGWGPFGGGGFNPVFDFDNDFGFKNNNQPTATRRRDDAQWDQIKF